MKGKMIVPSSILGPDGNFPIHLRLRPMQIPSVGSNGSGNHFKSLAPLKHPHMNYLIFFQNDEVTCNYIHL